LLIAVIAGLSNAEHSTRLSRDGPNALEGSGGIKIHVILLRHTINFLQGVLAVAAGISIAIGEYIDAGVIGFLILINIVVGFLQEYRAEKTLERLKNLSAPLATVIRDGDQKDVPSEDIVLGDVVVRYYLDPIL
jgi:magnesium-transporting ATPase (P-type)